MLAPITTLGLWGAPVAAPGPGVAPVAGPVVQLAFTLALAGRVPHHLEADEPQECQAETPNVQLVVTVVDQNGAPIDLSSAQGLLLWLLAPDGTPRPVGATLYSNGLDGKLAYVTAAGDLNQAGAWQVQAQVTYGTQILLSSWGSFLAQANIPTFPEAA